MEQQNEKDKKIHDSAIKLRHMTDNIQSQILSQEKILKNIEKHANDGHCKFAENQQFFQQSLKKMKNDGRNILIIFLLGLIILFFKLLKY
ncbi:hypothetical protein EHP00_114 [Ecytonucleospora hepatopenaei]|uniref:t-SNARE coiled-coil homology domain-containing protein n=1 Tax=Ecytonucleospora hepatopenaei TaxID=646526 RepID=A0A1W0E5Z4_9MICR|nr:hypothetical protein EHP00_114 [Ecytonucleospora hepatopenaei]